MCAHIYEQIRAFQSCLSTHQFQALPVPIGSSVVHGVVPLFVLDGWIGLVLQQELQTPVDNSPV